MVKAVGLSHCGKSGKTIHAVERTGMIESRYNSWQQAKHARLYVLIFKLFKLYKNSKAL